MTREDSCEIITFTCDAARATQCDVLWAEVLSAGDLELGPAMSSSRRSTQSTINTRSSKTPAWRSVSIIANKNTPSATLSYVFAEPEQGAPLASAAAKLPFHRGMKTSRSREVVAGEPGEQGVHIASEDGPSSSSSSSSSSSGSKSSLAAANGAFILLHCLGTSYLSFDDYRGRSTVLGCTTHA